MSRRTLIWVIAILLLVAFGILIRGETGAVSSALSRDASGWLAARRYLAANGSQVQLQDTPLSGVPDSGVLVLAFPWQHAVTAEDRQAIGRFLRQGGTVLVAYSGELGRPWEKQVLATLGLELTEVRPSPPLAPPAWWNYHNASWELSPADAWPEGPSLSFAAFRVAPEAPGAARVLYRLDDETPLIFSYPLHRGRVIALPAGVLSNAWIAESGNADLLESLRGWLGETWIFDEYHHGLVSAAALAESGSRSAWDLFAAHLALIYILGLATLARRFGPAWATTPLTQGSTSSFLRSLGTLHHDLAHHPAAARLLVERACAYDKKLSLDEATTRRAETVTGAAGLTELARTVARAQRRRTTLDSGSPV